MRTDPPRECIEMWRPAAGVLCIRGTTNHHAVDPNGELVVGVVTSGALLARRREHRHIVHAGEACVWDASARHTGSPYGGRQWAARLVVIEAPARDGLIDESHGARRAARWRDGGGATRWCEIRWSWPRCSRCTARSTAHRAGSPATACSSTGSPRSVTQLRRPARSPTRGAIRRCAAPASYCATAPTPTSRCASSRRQRASAGIA